MQISKGSKEPRGRGLPGQAVPSGREPEYGSKRETLTLEIMCEAISPSRGYFTQITFNLLEDGIQHFLITRIR